VTDACHDAAKLTIDIEFVNEQLFFSLALPYQALVADSPVLNSPPLQPPGPPDGIRLAIKLIAETARSYPAGAGLR
jgi:hypothetical protein